MPQLLTLSVEEQVNYMSKSGHPYDVHPPECVERSHIFSLTRLPLCVVGCNISYNRQEVSQSFDASSTFSLIVVEEGPQHGVVLGECKQLLEITRLWSEDCPRLSTAGHLSDGGLPSGIVGIC